MTLAAADTIISGLAFVFLIISGFELSIRFADKMKSMKELGVIEYTASVYLVTVPIIALLAARSALSTSLS
jgi:hypothetical protein